MSKWYVKSNTVEKIVSIPHSSPMVAAIAVFNDTNEFDIFDEYFYVDERGFRDYTNADSLTQIIKTPKVMIRAKEQQEKDLP
jgi:hypothetical protein